MGLLLLIRHGVTDTTGKRLSGWTPGVHLSERGRGQSERLVERLAGVPIRAIYSSPLERCLETAGPLVRARGMEITVRDELGEVHYGSWTGRPLAQLARTKLWRAIQHAPSRARFPGGESLFEVQDRAVQETDRILASHPRATVAIFSHGDVIRLLLAYLSGVHTDLFQRLVVDPASVSAVVAGDGVPRILKMNDTGDLSQLGPGRPVRRKVRG